MADTTELLVTTDDELRSSAGASGSAARAPDVKKSVVACSGVQVTTDFIYYIAPGTLDLTAHGCDVEHMFSSQIPSLLVTSTDPAVADSVRLALPGEAATIAEIQRRSWSAQLPTETARAMLGELAVEAMTELWQSAITRPPKAQFRVLVATQQHRVVGFATTIPSPDPDATDGQDGLVEEFVVDPPAQRRGHGSRLLHACVDTLRADGFVRATYWVTSTDDITRGFLTGAGWAPDGGWREIGTEDDAVRLKQIRLHTDIGATD